MFSKPKDFKWRHFQANIILWAVCWYSRFALSYRDLVVMAQERGLSITHTMLMRWAHEYAPKLDKKIKPHLESNNDSYRVDGAYIKIKGIWQYLYRAVDSDGNAFDSMLSRYCNQKTAKRFFKKFMGNRHCKKPRVINVDKVKAFPPAFAECQTEAIIPINTKLRQQKYLNNIQEQDHRFTKRRVSHSQ